MGRDRWHVFHIIGIQKAKIAMQIKFQKYIAVFDENNYIADHCISFIIYNEMLTCNYDKKIDMMIFHDF